MGVLPDPALGATSEPAADDPLGAVEALLRRSTLSGSMEPLRASDLAAAYATAAPP